MRSICATLPDSEKTTCRELQDGLFYKRINVACNVLLNTASAKTNEPVTPAPTATQALPTVTQTASDEPQTTPEAATKEQVNAVKDALKRVRKAIRLGFP